LTILDGLFLRFLLDGGCFALSGAAMSPGVIEAALSSGCWEGELVVRSMTPLDVISLYYFDEQLSLESPIKGFTEVVKGAEFATAAETQSEF
jgi:hypothetical protein